MNCCGGGDHKHDESDQKGNEHGHNETGVNWTQIGAVLLIVVLVAGMLLVFIK